MYNGSRGEIKDQYLERGNGSLVDPFLQFGIGSRLLSDFIHKRESRDSIGNMSLENSYVIGYDQIDPSKRITHEMTIRSIVLNSLVMHQYS